MVLRYAKEGQEESEPIEHANGEMDNIRILDATCQYDLIVGWFLNGAWESCPWVKSNVWKNTQIRRKQISSHISAQSNSLVMLIVYLEKSKYKAKISVGNIMYCLASKANYQCEL